MSGWSDATLLSITLPSFCMQNEKSERVKETSLLSVKDLMTDCMGFTLDFFVNNVTLSFFK